MSGVDPEGQAARGAGGHPGQREPRGWEGARPLRLAGVGERRAHMEGSVGLAEGWSLVVKRRQAENRTLTPTPGLGGMPRERTREWRREKALSCPGARDSPWNASSTG